MPLIRSRRRFGADPTAGMEQEVPQVRVVDLENAVVTADAVHAQREIGSTSREGKRAVTGNRTTS